MIMREKRRYLLFEVISDGEVAKHGLQNAIWDSIYSLYGDTGASESRLWLVNYDSGIGIGVLRCAHRTVEKVRAALACIYSVDGVRTAIRVIRVSGTLKGAMSSTFYCTRTPPRSIST